MILRCLRNFSNYYLCNNWNDIQKFHKPSLMMKQYIGMKKDHPNALILFRNGDFFESFFEDAKKIHLLLNIVLTKRYGGHYKNTFNKLYVPMVGFPHLSIESYINKLIKYGEKVAIVEQLEKTNLNDNIIPRKVTRLVTPGTILNDEESSLNNFLLAISYNKDSDILGLCYTDISTGEIYIKISSKDSLNSDISRISPSEILIKEDDITLIVNKIFNYREIITKIIKSSSYIEKIGKQLFIDNFGINQHHEYSKPELNACHIILSYINDNLKNNFPLLKIPNKIDDINVMQMDSITRFSLELNSNFLGEKKDSLISIINKTKTSIGGRLMRERLNSPLVDVKTINARLDMIDFLLCNNRNESLLVNYYLKYEKEKEKEEEETFNIKKNSLFKLIQSQLKNCYDIERCIQRISIDRANARDLNSIENTLNMSNEIKSLLKFISSSQQHPVPHPVPIIYKNIINDLGDYEDLTLTLRNAIVTEPPLLLNEGGFIKEGFSKQLDESRIFGKDIAQQIKKIEKEYRNILKIPYLNINYIRKIGYFVTIPNKYELKVKEIDINHKFIFMQTLKNAVRYRTNELSTLEGRIYHARSRSIIIELEIFKNLKFKIISNVELIRKTASALGNLDVSVSLAALAFKRNYCKPIINDSLNLFIKDGKHAIIDGDERNLNFITNDCSLDENCRSLFITGANMSGKSSYLRANSLIIILAQMGSFVPCKEAKIGIVDKLFSRVGASDSLVHDKSTFMKECLGISSILNSATKKSVVVLDEAARGTSASDGMNLARAILEHLHDSIDCRTFFSSHYFEIVTKFHKLEKLKCMQMGVKENDDKDLIFLYNLIPGVAKKSYGIECAKQAQIPLSIIQRAYELQSTNYTQS